MAEPHRTSPVLMESVAALLKQKKSVTEIASTTGLSTRTVTQFKIMIDSEALTAK